MSGLIVPPGARAPVALAVAGAVQPLIKPPTYPRIQRIHGQAAQIEGRPGMALTFHVQTSPIGGKVMAIGIPFDAPLTQLAQLLRDTATALDKVAADEADPDPTEHPSEPGHPGPA